VGGVRLWINASRVPIQTCPLMEAATPRTVAGMSVLRTVATAPPSPTASPVSGPTPTAPPLAVGVEAKPMAPVWKEQPLVRFSSSLSPTQGVAHRIGASLKVSAVRTERCTRTALVCIHFCSNVAHSPGEEDDDEKRKLAIIIGLSVAGGLFVFAVVATVIFVIVKRAQRSRGYQAINESA